MGKRLRILAGPNGSGKSSVYKTLCNQPNFVPKEYQSDKDLDFNLSPFALKQNSGYVAKTRGY